MQLVLGERLNRDRTERVQADMERDALDLEPAEQLRREVQARGRRRGRALASRVDGLVALRVPERLRDVRRQRRLAGRLPFEP